MAGEAWKDAELVRSYLEGVRGAIPLAREQVDVVLRLIERAGLPVRRFLDLGCGDGFLGAVLLERYPGAQGTFVDHSEPMLDAARRRLFPYEDRAEVRLADLARASWRDGIEGPFDAAVSGFAIHHLPDNRKRSLYAEVFELLRPGAFFLNIEHVASSTDWLVPVFDGLLIDSYYAQHVEQGKDVTREQIARDYVHRPDREENILAPVEAQCDWLREIGYQDVDCYFKLLELAVFGGRKGG
jgi:SAM-dependent methyltransferase